MKWQTMKNKIVEKWWSSLSINEMKNFIKQYTSTFTFNGCVCDTYNINNAPDFFIEKIAQKEGIISK